MFHILLTLSKWFPEFIKKYNKTIENKEISIEEKKGMYLPVINFHGLRHTSATFLIGKGMDIQTISSRLGHSTSTTTQNIYSHFLKSKDEEAANLMENSFGTKRPEKSVKKDAK